MIVRHLMSSPAVTAHLDETVPDVMRRMRTHHIAHVVIVDDAGKAIGLVARDALIPARRDAASLLSKWMRPLDASLAEDDPVAKAHELVDRRGLACVPVLEDGYPVGVVSAADLRRAAYMDWKSIPAIRAA